MLGHRYYDPALARFLTRDPIGYEGGINLYAYCGNNPIIGIDPDGTDWFDNVNSFVCGYGSALSFGGTDAIQHLMGTDSYIDRKSGYYLAGEVGGTIHQQLLFRGAGKALAARRAAQATAQVVKGTELGGSVTRSIRNINIIKAGSNCASCVVATDATLAGRAASAIRMGVTTTAKLEQFYQKSFILMKDSGDIVQRLQAAGPGARGIVYGYRGVGKVGHFFNVVNDGGKILFLDGQTGTRAQLIGQGFKQFKMFFTHVP